MKKMTVLTVVGLFLLSCNFVSMDPSQNTSLGEITPQSTISGMGVEAPPIQDTLIPIPSSTPTFETGGSSAAAGSGDVFVQLPLSPDIPSAEVIQQISVFAGGGSGIICERNCVSYSVDDNDHIYLTKFQPNQKNRIIFYYKTGYNPNGYVLFEFLKEIAAQTDDQGNLTIYLDWESDYPYVQIMVLDESGNILFDPEALR